MDEMTVFSRWIDAVSARSDAPGATSVRVDCERNRGDAKRSTTVCEPGGPSTRSRAPASLIGTYRPARLAMKKTALLPTGGRGTPAAPRTSHVRRISRPPMTS